MPAGHEATHVLPYRNWPPTQEVQLLADPVQVAQGDVHATQVEPDAIVPLGQVL